MTEAEPSHSGNVQWSDSKGSDVPMSLPQGSMLSALERVEAQLPDLLRQPEVWRSLDVTYHPPRVERVYTDFEELRISLHCIHPCSKDEALFHPHPWPSSMRLLTGQYEMGVGFGSGQSEPPRASTIVLSAGSTYEMVDPDSWHYVRPLNEAVMTLMVTGQPWERTTPKASGELAELSTARKSEILEIFREKYPSRV